MFEEAYWLMVYPGKSGQWVGRVSKGDEPVFGIADCSSPDQVEAAAYEQFPDIEEVVLGFGPP